MLYILIISIIYGYHIQQIIHDNYKMLSQLAQKFFKSEFKILPVDTSKWTSEQIIRLSTLLKITDPLKQIIDFDNITTKSFLSLSFLKQQLESRESRVTQSTFFPFQKFKAAIGYLNDEYEQQLSSDGEFEENNLPQSQIDLPDEKVLALRDAVDKLGDTKIIQMSCSQISSIFKSIGMQNQSLFIKKTHTDGYTLLCSLTNLIIKKNIKNLFCEEEITMLNLLSTLFIMHHLRRDRYKQPQFMQKKSTEQFKQQTSINLKNNQNLHELVIGSGYTQKGSDDQFSKVCQSVLGISIDPDIGMSELGQSMMGESEYGQSEYEESVRDSVYADSQYGFPTRDSVDCRTSFNVIRTSFLYNDEVFNSMKSVSMDLPFDLLNLQPLQQIKLRSLLSPFSLEKGKDHWMFSVQGVKLGRDKSNDLNFPDQLSISSRHSLISFNNDAFYLQDVGSKTGTYFRIPKTLIIEEETCLQFSPDIQIVFRIIKKNKKDGLIKAEIKRPENYPDYKVSLREGYKIQIGRSQKCHIRINNPGLAQRHAQVFYKNGLFLLRNQNPKHGIWQRLSQKSVKSDTFRLRKGDIFRLSSKKSFLVEDIVNQLSKSVITGLETAK